MPDPERASIASRRQPIDDEFVSRTDTVRGDQLNDEDTQLCRRLAAALRRERPSSVTRGWIDSWACGLADAIGSVNVLADTSQTPHATMAELCAFFGVSPSTGAAKAAVIRHIVRMHQEEALRLGLIPHLPRRRTDQERCRRATSAERG